MGVELNYPVFNQALKKLRDEYRIYAPVRFEKRGCFSDTDMIRYDEVSRVEEMVWDEKSVFSPKEIIFPITQTLFYFTEEDYREPTIDEKKTLVFLRACDLNGIRRLDTIYLKNGTDEDSYYKRLRNKIKFVLVECTESFDNCFCVSMNSNTVDAYDIAARFDRNIVTLDIQDAELAACFEAAGTATEFSPKFIMENQTRVRTPDVEEMPLQAFDHEMWDEYKTRCIACGRCNTTCITCSCFSTSDLFYDENTNVGERRRMWASCHIDGFTDMAGGHEFRQDNGSRMRFKTFHKVYDYKKRFGEHMCVGCGRCDDNCPEYISFSECINKLNKLI